LRRANTALDTLTGVVTAATVLAIYAPLAVICVFSLFPAVRVRGSLELQPFSTQSYAALTRNADIIEALSRSLVVGVLATGLSILAAFAFALFHARTTGWQRAVMQGIVFLPLLFPPIVTGLALLMSFHTLDIARGVATIVVGHVVLIVPIAYRTMLARLQSLNPNLIEASLDLGASQIQTYRFVLWPHLATAVISAALLSFALSFDETLVTLFLSGSEMTLPIRLWAMVRLGFVPEVNALAALILLVAAGTTVAISLLLRTNGSREAEN